MQFNEDYIDICVYRTVIEMLQDRGYYVPNNLLSLTDDEIIKRITNENSENEDNKLYFGRIPILEKSKSNRIIVFFIDNMKIKKEHVGVLDNICEENNVNHCIVVYNGKFNHHVIKGVQHRDTFCNFSLFTRDSLCKNVTKHIWIPKHILLNKQERNDFLKEYTSEELPVIKMDDPISKYFGAKEGDIFKIIRNNSSLGYQISYRICVN